MCKNATKTAADLMSGIRPTLVSLLTLEGIASTPQGIAALNAYDAADTALAAWVPGTTSEVIIEGINAFEQVFNTLPIPTDAKTLADLILAGVTTVIGIITANSPAPAAPAGTPAIEETQIAHQVSVAHATTLKVQTLVPSFKMSKFHSPESQYHSAWNKEVEKLGGKFSSLKQ